MPLPSPNKNESKDSFVQRCMSNNKMNEEYPDEDQRAAVCYSRWSSKGNKKEASVINNANKMLAELKGLLGYWNDRDKEK